MRYRLAPEVRLVDEGNDGLLVRNYPLRTIRCNNSLWQRLRLMEMEGVIVSSSPLMESLAEAGFLQRVWDALPWSKCPVVSVIIPVKNRESELQRCLDSLRQLDYPGERLEIIVVDDGSTDNSAKVAMQAGVICISSGGVGRGPAAARNRGARIARGRLLAFLDSDCTASPGWLRELTAPFVETDTVAVGGLVRGYFTNTRLDRYEDTMSSLVLGKNERWGGSGNDSFYLPSCNLLVEKKYFQALGGFDEKMLVGEDVDLCYRLRDRGYRIGYVPFGEIFHAHRNRIVSFMSRRFAYGTSEALLQKRHTARHKKMQMSVASLLLLILLPTIFVVPPWGLVLFAGVFSANVGQQCVKMYRVHKQLSVAKIFIARCRSLFSLGYYLSYHVIRYYLPILVGISIFDFQVATFVILTFIWSASVDYVTKRANLGFLSFAFFYFLEQFAYSCGVFWGCLKQSRFASYRITLQFSSAFEIDKKLL